MCIIRNITKADLPALAGIIESNDLFPPELIEGMTADYLDNPSTTDMWLTAEWDGVPVAMAYYAPERMTEGTYNLYLIAVNPAQQGKGIGGSLMEYIEEELRSQGARILIVETSGLPEFERTRQYYDRCGYAREAVIREFYAEDDDKVVFWKKLA